MAVTSAPSCFATRRPSGLAMVNSAEPEMTSCVAPVEPLKGVTVTSSPASFQNPSASGTDECVASAMPGLGDVSRYRILVCALAGCDSKAMQKAIKALRENTGIDMLQRETLKLVYQLTR